MNNKVLIIGAGRIAQEFDTPDDNKIQTHIKGYKYFDDTFNVKAFYDIDNHAARIAASRWDVPKVITDLEEIKIKEYDVISICTPDDTHKNYLLKAIALEPKAIFLEKPIGLTYQEAKKVFETSNEKGILVLVNFSRLYIPEFASLGNNLLKNNNQVLSINIKYHKGFYHNCSHFISLLSLWFNPVFDEVIVYDLINDYSSDDYSISALVRARDYQNRPFNLHIQAYDQQIVNLSEVDIITSKARIIYHESKGSSISYFNIEAHDIGMPIKEYVLEDTSEVDYNLALVNAIDIIRGHLEGHRVEEVEKFQNVYLNTLNMMEKIKYSKKY